MVENVAGSLDSFVRRTILSRRIVKAPPGAAVETTKDVIGCQEKQRDVLRQRSVGEDVDLQPRKFICYTDVHGSYYSESRWGSWLRSTFDQ